MKYVSIILPTYNRAYCIRRAIDSILHQTYTYWELLVIDDGSTDDTKEIVKEIAASEKRVHYYKLPSNGGVAAARNEGIRQAKYSYIAFQDSDDIWMEDKLEKQMQIFDEQSAIGLVYCAFMGTKQDGTMVRIPSAAMKMDKLQGNLYPQLLQQNIIGAPAAVVCKECLEQCGMFDVSLNCLEDWELFLRISKEYAVGYVNEELVLYDIHEGGVSSHVGGYFYSRCKMIVDHKEALIEYGLFQHTVEKMLMLAKNAGVFEQAAQMLQSMLTGGYAD